MEEGIEADSDANFAHYALHELKIRPKDYIEMDFKEKAFIIASIKVRLDDEKEAAKKAKKK